jgi:hypothetical protein
LAQGCVAGDLGQGYPRRCQNSIPKAHPREFTKMSQVFGSGVFLTQNADFVGNAAKVFLTFEFFKI